jgi:predicted RNA binding protein YcfA (HicA-like mRNA interferase family)
MKLPQVRPRDCITALQRAGFTISRQSGSHVILKQAGRRAIVPRHNKPIAEGTLRRILDQAGLTDEEFLDLL